MHQKLLVAQQEKEEFDRSVKEHREAPGSGETNNVPEDEREESEACDLVYKPLKRIRAGVEVRCQSVVAMCIVKEPTDGDGLFMLLGCFESTAEADHWIQNVGSRKIHEHDILVAPTCEWIYPNSEGGKTSTQYRNPELQRIMDAAEKNPELVQTYKEWKAEQEKKEADTLLSSPTE